jgi:predicted small lipoprotein YifL
MIAKRIVPVSLLVFLLIVVGAGCRSKAPLKFPKGVITESRPAKEQSNRQLRKSGSGITQGSYAPGQMKKATGDKNAKRYSPGQSKKRKKR